MGTVGISFGSPTSGQGFNVQQTVSQIIANYQNVETPWKNQITQLQAQDAAYTSLGSDLATLTASMQSLTDFQGVLSEKQGSSSDTNVLQLTSASNSAVAGSHTITVGNLASTASSASSVVANASDLIVGAMQFTIGGKPQTVTIPNGGETLAALSDQINSAAIGITANVITDPSGSVLSLVSNNSGSAGNFSLTGSSVTDSSNGNAPVNFTQGQAGVDASLTVDGVSITSGSNTVTNAIPGVTFQLLSAPTAPTPVQVEITNNNTAVETAMQNFVTGYNQVMKDIQTQEGNDSTGKPEPLYGNPNLSMIQSQLQSAFTFMTSSGITATAGSGSPASWLLQAPSASDTYTAAAGTFGSGSGGIGMSAAITTPSTLTQIAAGLNVAGTGYSATLDSTNTILTVAAAGSSPATLAAGAPVLASSGKGSITSITQLGISANPDGTLTFNSNALDSVLNSNYQGAVSFLQPGNGYASFGDNFNTALNNLGNEGPNGAVHLALQSNQATEQTLNTDIANENQTISTQQTQLTTELNQANYILEEIPQQLAGLNETYSAVTGYNVQH